MKISICRFAGLLLVAMCIAAAEAPGQERHVTLEMRKDNGPYKNAAYSFRKASADETIHRNYVDLLFNRCGSLHVNMVNGQENRICDLGKVSLKEAPDGSPADAKWFTECVKPEPGHVYLEEVKQHGQTMTVKFIVDEATADTVKLTWVTVKPLEGADDPNRGAGGRMGQCGGQHENH